MSFRDRVRRWLERCVAAPWARARAAWAAFAGRPEAAERSLRRAADAAPRSFGVQIAWGRLLLALGRDAEARVAFRRACRLAPARFLRQNLPASLREVVVLECEAAEPDRGGSKAATAPETAASACAPHAAAEPPPPRSDFVDAAEARRFQSMGPLGKTAAKNVDWDDLLDRLARPPTSGGARGS